MDGQTDISSEAGRRWELAACLIRDRKLGLAILGIRCGLSIVGNVIYGAALVAKVQSGEIPIPQSLPAPAP